MISLFEKYEFIKEVETLAYEYSDNRIFCKFRLMLSNNSMLKAQESISSDQRSYSFHWQDQNNKLLYRWDSSPHHLALDNFPFHVHIGDKDPISSKEMLIEDVLEFIKSKIN